MSRGKHPVWRVLKVVVGVLFLGLGVIGLFVPILQGVLFLLIGLSMLSTESRWVRGLLERVRRSHPGPWNRAQALRRRLLGWWKGRVRESADGVSNDEGPGGQAS